MNVTKTAGGAENMAADSVLLELAVEGRSGFRVYGWDGVWVSLGMNQRPSEALVAPDETNWVMRPTGGSAVLHGHDVTVSIALPMARESGRGHSYRYTTGPLVKALNRLGVPAILAEDLGQDRAYKLSPDCFATTTRNDIIDRETGEKICGCALRRTKTAVLLQASIPATEPLIDPASVIKGGVRTALTTIDSKELARLIADVIP